MKPIFNKSLLKKEIFRSREQCTKPTKQPQNALHNPPKRCIQTLYPNAASILFLVYQKKNSTYHQFLIIIRVPQTHYVTIICGGSCLWRGEIWSSTIWFDNLIEPFIT